MKIAFLNLCHCDPDLVARAAGKLGKNENFHMYIHVDQKTSEAPFREKTRDLPNVFFVRNRKKVYWGGFHAIEATIELMREALESREAYDYFLLLQNLDYPIKSNREIEAFFRKHHGKEFIRACRIGGSRDRHFQEKYKLYHQFDDDFYLRSHSQAGKLFHDLKKVIRSVPWFTFSGMIKEGGNTYPLYYGAAQWALTRDCVRYILDFYDSHPGFNQVMRHIKFPDEEYFHTIVHNSEFKYRCLKYDEPERRWLVNWRNLHYFEYPKEITVFEEKDFEKLMGREELFCRKVRTGVSDRLLDKIDERTEE